MSPTIFTSNYARSSQYHLSVAISRKPPDWYSGNQLPQLAPTWEMITNLKSNKITQDQYSELYITLLIERNLTPKKIITLLPNECRLLCYEKVGEFCHRRVLAQWIEDEIGVVIPEWISEQQVKHEQFINDVLEF